MINNMMELWYWIIMLFALIGVGIYFSYSFVRNLWLNLREKLDDDRPTIFTERVTEPYSKRMIIIHWLTLVLLIVAWYLGEMLFDARSEKSATLIGYYAHVLAGITILLLTILRLTFRTVDRIPPPLSNSLMDMAAKGIHSVLYILLLLLSATGFMTLLTSSLGEALIAADAKFLPEKYTGPGVIPHALHDTLMTVLMVVVAIHILGVIKHQFIAKDGLMRRMSLRSKNAR